MKFTLYLHEVTNLLLIATPKMSTDFECPLRLQLPHTLFQIKSVLLGSASGLLCSEGLSLSQDKIFRAGWNSGLLLSECFWSRCNVER